MEVVLPVGMGHPGAETEPSGPDDEGSSFSFCTVKPEDILAEGRWSNPLQVQRHTIEEAEIGTPSHLGPQLRVRLVIRRVWLCLQSHSPQT